MTLHAAGESDPPLRYGFGPAAGQRRNVSPHPFLSRAMLLAKDAMAQDRDQQFTNSLIHISELPLDQLSNPETWQFLDQYATAALGHRDEVTVLFFDGSVRTFQRSELDNQKLAAMFTIAGGEVQR